MFKFHCHLYLFIPSIFRLRSEINSVNTRNRHLYELPKSRTTLCKNLLFYTGQMLFNKLLALPFFHDVSIEIVGFLKFKNIAKLARKFLSMSVSSVHLESMFSTMGLILNCKRSSLSPP